MSFLTRLALIVAASLTFIGTGKLVGPSAEAGTILDARDLLDACTRADMDWINFCNGFMQAVSDIAVVSGRACVPAGTTRTDLVEQFEAQALSIIALQPEAGSIAGVDLTTAIFEQVYPCG